LATDPKRLDRAEKAGCKSPTSGPAAALFPIPSTSAANLSDQHACFGSDHKSIEVALRPRKGSRPFAPVAISRRGASINSRKGVTSSRGRRGSSLVNGKHQLTNAYMLFLVRWARRLSWKETVEAFHSSCRPSRNPPTISSDESKKWEPPWRRSPTT